jgi:hypothetical protein
MIYQRVSPVVTQPVEFGKTNVSTEDKALITRANKVALAPDKMTADQLNALSGELDAIYKAKVETGSPTDPSVKRLEKTINDLKASINGSFTDSSDAPIKLPGRGYAPPPVVPSTAGLTRASIGEDMLRNDKEMADNRKLFADPLTNKALQKNVNRCLVRRCSHNKPLNNVAIKNTVSV